MPWNPHNLTAHSGAPHAIDGPVSHVFAFEGTQHVFHRGLVGDEHPREGLVEIWWRSGQKPQWDDLFAGLSDDAHGFAMWLACHVVEAERTQHVFYAGPDISELWWPSAGGVNAGNLPDQAGQPKLGGFGLASHVFLEEGTQHVFFIASGEIDGMPVDGHVGELWWRGADKAQLADLTKRAGGAPTPDSTLASHVVEGPYTAERSQHVFYQSGRDIFELRWGTDAVTTVRNLTGGSAGENEPAAGAPASHVDPDGTHHVFYVADNAHVIEVTWQGENEPVARDLTAHSTGIGPTPIAISAPTSHLFLREGTHHVYYVAQGNHVIELWWLPGDQPHHEDLTAQSGVTSLAQPAKPASHVFDDEGTQHVFYTSTAGEIIELWWQP